eukprot:jgi/Sobl393_1/18821/SZX79129.1
MASSRRRTRMPGESISRDYNWVAAINSEAAALRSQSASFLFSNDWSCTNLGGRGGCTGNMEMIHNNVHNTIGGDMSTLSAAAWDPLFWLLHVNIDRLLVLHQIGTGDYFGLSNYEPFPEAAACGSNTQDCGYTYEERVAPPQTPTIGWSVGGSAQGAMRLAGNPNAIQNSNDSSDSQQGSVAISSVQSDAGRVQTYEPAAGISAGSNSTRLQQYLRQYINSLTGGYNGYSWSAVIDGLNPMALREHTYAMHVLVNDGACAEAGLPMTADGQRIDMLQLRKMDAYCGSNAGWNTMAPGMTSYRNVTVAININHCMAACGISPDVPAKDPTDPTQGPISSPITPSKLRVLCIQQSPSGEARDCTRQLAGKLSWNAGLGWAVLSERFVAGAQTFAARGAVRSTAAATAAAGGRVRPRGVPGAIGHPQFLFVGKFEP